MEINIKIILPYIYGPPFTSYSISSLFHNGMSKFILLSKINLDSIDLTIVSYTLLIKIPLLNNNYNYDSYINNMKNFNSLIYYLHNNNSNIGLLFYTYNPINRLKEYYIIISSDNSDNNNKECLLLLRIPTNEQILYEHNRNEDVIHEEYNNELISYIYNIIIIIII